MKIYHILFLVFPLNLFSQVFLNEASNANVSTFVLPNGTDPDWIELYNSSNANINMVGYFLSDDSTNLQKWTFPNLNLPPNGFVTIAATSNLNQSTNYFYETAVFANNTWKYIIPNSNLAPDWNNLSFDASAWNSGQMSVGYGDDDDEIEISNPTTSVYALINFSISDTSKIKKALLDLDFDDGFVAYLNGIEIARVGLTGTPPNWDELATDNEATLIQGGNISSFEINQLILKSAMKNGQNVLAIEVHNSSTTSSDLTMLPFLSFGYETPNSFYGGNVHSYFNTVFPNSTLETNFSISNEGEIIYLSNPLGIVIDSLIVPDLEPDMSVGKFMDGIQNDKLFTLPTPGQSNNLSLAFEAFENPPIINIDAQFFQDSLKITISNNSFYGGQVYYTLNGDTPTINSNLYMDTISIFDNSILKAICISSSDSILPSLIAIESYFLAADYALPVISITTDSLNLYGPDGIFDNYNTDWKKPCVIEYFDKEGIKQFESRASIKPDGGAGGSRSNPQHSVTIEPSNLLYGEGKPIKYPLIPEKSFIKEFDAFYLRNGSNYWNQYPQKDATFMRIMRESNANSQAYSPVIAYVNGEYFGVYELREKANEGYFSTNFGNDKDSLDLLSVSYFYGAGVLRTVKGSDSSFYSMKDLVTTYDPAASDYFSVCNKKLDLYNFTDYLVGENWFANYDWIYNNMKIARTQSTDNKWKFFLQDMELGLGGWSDFNSNLFDYFRNENQPNPYWEIFNGLNQNTEFKNYFVNRYADLMNTTFQPDYYLPIVESMYQQLLPDLPKHFERWTGDPTGGMNNYLNIKNNILYQFSNRNQAVRNQIVNEFALVKPVTVYLNVEPAEAGYIKISTIVPDQLPWTGVYFDGVPVEITAVANPGYIFNHWKANTTLASQQLDSANFTINIGSDDSYIAVFTGISEPLSLTISEINYNPDPSVDGGNWIELHNFGTTHLNLTNWSIKSKNFWDKYDFEDGVSIPSEGYLVICEDTNLFKNTYPNVTNFVGATGFPWSNKFDSIQVYDAHKKLVINTTYTDEKPFPICADGWGRTLENQYLNSVKIDSSNWFCGCIGGSPGAKYTPCDEQLQISEINYNNISAVYNAGDWIEIKNNSGQELDLLNYVFKDAKNNHIFNFPSIVLQPNNYLVLTNSKELFQKRHPEVENVIGSFDFGLSNKEILRLFDASETLISSIIYRNDDNWPVIPSLEDFTLEYNFSNGFVDPNAPTSWFAGCEGGSPGRAFENCPVLTDGDFCNIYPNPTNGSFTVAFQNENNSSNKTKIQIIDMNGRLIFEEEIYAIEATVGKEINLDFARAGMYFVKVIQESKTKQLRIVKI